MESSSRESNTPLVSACLRKKILAESSSFSFVQAMKLLGLITGANRKITIRPKLSLTFPHADVAEINPNLAVTDDFLSTPKGYELLVTFLGLYGESSPLPVFYTEDLIEEDMRGNEPVMREFIDFIGQRGYELFYLGLCKHNLPMQIFENNNKVYLDRISSLFGCNGQLAQDDLASGQFYSRLRYSSILGNSTKSASGLRTLLKDRTGLDIDIEQCVSRWASIQDEDLNKLGERHSKLGLGFMLGARKKDGMNKFRILVKHLKFEQFKKLIPGEEIYNIIVSYINIYLKRPMLVELKLELDAAEPPPLCLGEKNAILGRSSWVFSGAEMGKSTIKFECY